MNGKPDVTNTQFEFSAWGRFCKEYHARCFQPTGNHSRASFIVDLQRGTAIVGCLLSHCRHIHHVFISLYLDAWTPRFQNGVPGRPIDDSHPITCSPPKCFTLASCGMVWPTCYWSGHDMSFRRIHRYRLPGSTIKYLKFTQTSVPFR